MIVIFTKPPNLSFKSARLQICGRMGAHSRVSTRRRCVTFIITTRSVQPCSPRTTWKRSVGTWYVHIWAKMHTVTARWWIKNTALCVTSKKQNWILLTHRWSGRGSEETNLYKSILNFNMLYFLLQYSFCVCEFACMFPLFPLLVCTMLFYVSLFFSSYKQTCTPASFLY